jgi:hypothetical protein
MAENEHSNAAQVALGQAMTKQHIDRLKELLIASKDPHAAMEYFLRHVVTDAEIVRASRRHRACSCR